MIDPPVQPVPVAPTSSTPVTSHSNKSALYVVLVVVLLAVVGAGSYFLGQQSGTQTAQPAASIPTPTTPPTVPTPDETANWKTYSSSKYGFSFKYPSNYTVEENKGNGVTPDEVTGYLLKDENGNTGLKFLEGDGGFGCGGPKSDKTITLKLGMQTITIEELCGRYPIRVTNKAGAILNIEHYPYEGDPYTETDKKILESVVGLQK